MRLQSRQAILLILALLFVTTGVAGADDWPQWLGPKRDGVWRETGILAKFPAGRPKDQLAHADRRRLSGPAVANGKVYVTDRMSLRASKNPDNPFRQEGPKSPASNASCA